jgi:hypothetical protein
VAPAIVADHRLGRPSILDDLVQALALQRRVGLDRLVEIVDIGLVMLVVVELHGLRVDVRLQRIVGVGQRGDFEGHGVSPG